MSGDQESKYKDLPQHMQEAMRDYIEKGKPTGAFLKALMSNNLVLTFMYADPINRDRIKDFITFLLSNAPRNSWGSEELVDNWIASKGDRK